MIYHYFRQKILWSFLGYLHVLEITHLRIFFLFLDAFVIAIRSMKKV